MRRGQNPPAPWFQLFLHNLKTAGAEPRDWSERSFLVLEWGREFEVTRNPFKVPLKFSSLLYLISVRHFFEFLENLYFGQFSVIFYNIFVNSLKISKISQKFKIFFSKFIQKTFFQFFLNFLFFFINFICFFLLQRDYPDKMNQMASSVLTCNYVNMRVSWNLSIDHSVMLRGLKKCNKTRRKFSFSVWTHTVKISSRMHL